MRERGRGRRRIAFLIVMAVLAIVFAVLEAFADHPQAPNTPAAPWVSHLNRVDEALRRNTMTVAVHAWHAAYATALGSRRWEGMLAVGDAALRIGDATRTQMAARARAHEAYLMALFRAREAKSVEGLLHVAEALATVGDTALALHALRIAEPFVAANPRGSSAHRTILLRDRLGEPSTARRQMPRVGDDVMERGLRTEPF
jgi:hypothetical protein